LFFPIISFRGSLELLPHPSLSWLLMDVVWIFQEKENRIQFDCLRTHQRDILTMINDVISGEPRSTGSKRTAWINSHWYRTFLETSADFIKTIPRTQLRFASPPSATVLSACMSSFADVASS
jgi:hypothetical protein